MDGPHRWRQEMHHEEREGHEEWNSMNSLSEGHLIVEWKRVEQIKGIHKAQLLTYMKSSGIQIGLLFNFNVTKRKNGIKRFVLRFLRALRELRGEK